VPTPMVEESFFSVPTDVTPMVQDNMVVEPIIDSPVPMVVTPIISSLMAETNEKEKPVF
jgi:hypothetical protein